MDARGLRRLRRRRFNFHKGAVQLLLCLQRVQEFCLRLLWQERRHNLLFKSWSKKMPRVVPLSLRLLFAQSRFSAQHRYLLRAVHPQNTRGNRWIPCRVPQLPEASYYHRAQQRTSVHHGLPKLNKEDESRPRLDPIRTCEEWTGIE